MVGHSILSNSFKLTKLFLTIVCKAHLALRSSVSCVVKVAIFISTFRSLFRSNFIVSVRLLSEFVVDTSGGVCTSIKILFILTSYQNLKSTHKHNFSRWFKNYQWTKKSNHVYQVKSNKKVSCKQRKRFHIAKHSRVSKEIKF